MSKFKLKDFLEKELEAYKSSFKQTSYDDAHQQYLCQDESRPDVYDFDEYIKANYNKSRLPASPDAIHIDNKRLYCVEFKNQRSSQIDNHEIQRKFTNGTEILQKMLKNFTPRDCQYHFYVVFKTGNKPRYFDYRHIQRSTVLFNLEKLNQDFNHFYDRILTESIDFFIDEFQDLRCEGSKH